MRPAVCICFPKMMIKYVCGMSRHIDNKVYMCYAMILSIVLLMNFNTHTHLPPWFVLHPTPPNPQPSSSHPGSFQIVYAAIAIVGVALLLVGLIGGIVTGVFYVLFFVLVAGVHHIACAFICCPSPLPFCFCVGCLAKWMRVRRVWVLAQLRRHGKIHNNLPPFVRAHARFVMWGSGMLKVCSFIHPS